MSEQLGWRKALDTLKEEAPQWGRILPELPRLLHAQLQKDSSAELAEIRLWLAMRERREARNFWVMLIVLLATLAIFWTRSG
jgi:ubiquinone biosynthesis protein